MKQSIVISAARFQERAQRRTLTWEAKATSAAANSRPAISGATDSNSQDWEPSEQREPPMIETMRLTRSTVNPVIVPP